LSIIRNYVRRGYRNIIVDDLQDHRIQQLPGALHDVPLRIVTLVISDPSELRRRITSRNDGWKDPEAAVAWNQRVLDRPCVKHECKIDVTGKSQSAVLDEVINELGVPRPASAATDGVPA
jgi:hypothetical protein